VAFWKKKDADYEAMDQIIQDNPGILPAELARLLGVERSTILRRLPSLEEAGYTYSEDKRGRLWPFGKKK
jgi:DNA-binding IclR family transcriptional regulator